MAKKKVVIAGALGLVGRGAIEEYEAAGNWEILGLSRRLPDFEANAEFLSVDLRNRDDVEAKLSGIKDATHLVYAAVYEKPNLTQGWAEADHQATNAEMLRNFVEVMTKASPGIQHVLQMQGAKAYGVHLGPSKNPKKESDGRYMSPNFYHPQEDFLREASRNANWTWTALRPQIVTGFAVGSPLCVVPAVGIYAALSKELGMPLRFPGSGTGLLEATDNRLLGKAMIWAGTTPACGGEAFNITNGDCFSWMNVFPRIADLFDMEYADPHPISIGVILADKAPIWDEIVKKHGLKPYSLSDLIAAPEFANFSFHYGTNEHPSIMSTIKARKYGFQECLDTEDRLIELLEELQRDRILPSYRAQPMRRSA